MRNDDGKDFVHSRGDDSDGGAIGRLWALALAREAFGAGWDEALDAAEVWPEPDLAIENDAFAKWWAWAEAQDWSEAQARHESLDGIHPRDAREEAQKVGGGG
jgi:hypothetical protein